MTRDLTATLGHAFPPVRFPIERSKLREFALALGDDDPVWHDESAARAAGFDGVPLPPTATVIAAHWTPGELIGRPLGLGLDVARLLHGESAWTFSGAPLRLGDVLVARAEVTDVQQREGRRGGTLTLLTITTAFTRDGDRDGEVTGGIDPGPVAVLRDVWVEQGEGIA